MSIIVGTRKPRGTTVSSQEVLNLAVTTERFASGSTSVAAQGRVGMGFQPYYTHERSKLESQPVTDTQGNMLALDGRIDNHVELGELLDIRSDDTPDSLIVLTAFARWGEACFSRLIGDWAVALWSASEQVVYLARDHAGTRTLYFRNTAGVLVWSTYLETLLADRSAYSLDEQYAACYLTSQPLRDLTPYKHIRSVPPAHFLAVRDGHVTKVAHWESMVKDKIRYRSDRDYEEHFLSLFQQSVKRRTARGAPILAQLSGGMDSTSIVCMSDRICRGNSPATDPVNTLSFYDDSEPNWDERPYFSLVEAKRGKIGIHVATSFFDRSFAPLDPPEGVTLLPGADSSDLDWEKQLQNRLSEGGYKAILSGIGGDEVLGGVPTPLPELADHLAFGNLAALFEKTLAWCLVDRTPFAHRLLETIKFTAGLYRQSSIDAATIPTWISPHLRTLCIHHAKSPASEGQRFGILPSAISNGSAWWSIMETLPHLVPSILTRYEYRYPFLDRDLVDFLFRIPREQLVRPGRRRSLMRRSLRDIVPVEILERRRKAFRIRCPLASLQRSRATIEALFTNSVSAEYGFIDPKQLRVAIALTVAGSDSKWFPSLSRAISFELWLKATSRFVNPVLSNIATHRAAPHPRETDKLYASRVATSVPHEEGNPLFK